MERLSSNSRASCSSRAYFPASSGVPLIRPRRSPVRPSGAIFAAPGDESPARSISTSTTQPPSNTPTLSPSPSPASEADTDALTTTLSSESEEEKKGLGGKTIATALSLFGIAFLLGGGYVLKDQIKGFLDFFVTAVEDWGPWGYAAYAAVYIGLEVLALPAIPLTMTAGAIFGTTQGTAIVSMSATVAAAISFLIARYLVRDKVRRFAGNHPRFRAIDKAIGQNGLKFVTLLRLSPLLPLSASNYLYGLTSVDLGSYMLGSWIGMLPGTWAYVHTGAIGRAVLMEGEGALTIDPWQVGLGLGATLLALGFVGRLAKNAIDEVDAEEQGHDKAQDTNTSNGNGSSSNGSTKQ